MSIRIKAERASLQPETPVRVQDQNLNASVEEKDTTEIPIVDTTITEDAGEENSVIRRRSTSADEDLASESDVDAEPSPLKRIKSEGRQVIKKEKIVHLSALQLREVQKSLASLRKKRYDQKYRREWENTFNWVARSKKSELCFYCKICQRDYYGGSTELMRHEVTRKHENNAKKREIEGDANDYHDEDTTPPNHLTVEYEDRTPKEEYILSPNHDKFLQSRGSEDNLELMTIIEKKLDSSLVSDPFDVFGKHIANKLRTLTPEQNRFAQKLVMDVLFEGEMENLDRNTKVVKCGVSCMCT